MLATGNTQLVTPQDLEIIRRLKISEDQGEVVAS